ncbi:MAG: hypothetical protein IPF99_09255 [Deltaproteobacteria bacterium]|nr:hypothetical protein [Deltaproteobacteria bacterium]
MRPAALALVATLALGRAAVADPTVVQHERPRFSLIVPDGFVRVEPDGATRDLLGVFRREGDLPDEPPMVLQLLHLDAIVPQRPLLPPERAEFRRADGFRFTDHVEHDRVLGFPVETLVGVSALTNGASVTRFATAVPLDDDAVLVVLLAPSHRASAARSFCVPRSTRCAPRPPGRAPRVARSTGSCGWSCWPRCSDRWAMASPPASLPAARRCRSAPGGARPPSLAALWWSAAAWLCVPWREHEWLFAVQSVGFAVTFSALAWRARAP